MIHFFISKYSLQDLFKYNKCQTHTLFLCCRQIENSEWILQLQNLMRISSAIVDLIDLQSSSVSIGLDDGWDITTIVSSIAQLCLDPYYRTINGFRSLIEKEWLSFGHKFFHRNLTINSQIATFTPTFLQFLDITHQILEQFPFDFEFNDFYLKFLAYHSVSNKFNSFLFNFEYERFGHILEKKNFQTVVNDEKMSETIRVGESVYSNKKVGDPNHSTDTEQNIFDYIQSQHDKFSSFCNFKYFPNVQNRILRPVSLLTCLDIWNYYYEEELVHEHFYDMETTQQNHYDDQIDKFSMFQSSRRMIINGYDCVSFFLPNEFVYLLEETYEIETDLDRLPQKWYITLDNVQRHGFDMSKVIHIVIHKR